MRPDQNLELGITETASGQEWNELEAELLLSSTLLNASHKNYQQLKKIAALKGSEAFDAKYEIPFFDGGETSLLSGGQNLNLPLVQQHQHLYFI